MSYLKILTYIVILSVFIEFSSVNTLCDIYTIEDNSRVKNDVLCFMSIYDQFTYDTAKETLNYNDKGTVYQYFKSDIYYNDFTYYDTPEVNITSIAYEEGNIPEGDVNCLVVCSVFDTVEYHKYIIEVKYSDGSLEDMILYTLE